MNAYSITTATAAQTMTSFFSWFLNKPPPPSTFHLFSNVIVSIAFLFIPLKIEVK